MTVTSQEVLACLLRMLIILTLRIVLAPGVAQMSVVAAAEAMAVFCFPGVTVVPFKSTKLQ